MFQWTKQATTLLLGLGLWVFCFCVYLSNLPQNYTYDGMVFASRVEGAHTALFEMFHPHHLIYVFLGRLLFFWGRAHGAAWDGLVTLQFFDLVTGTLGVVLVFHLLVRETNDRIISFLSAAGMAMSFSYWYFSTTPGVRILATVTPLFAWYVLSFLKKAPPLFGIAIGAAHSLAVLGHQTNLLLVPAFLGGIWCLKERTAGEKFRASLYYLVTLTVGVLSVYGFVGRYVWQWNTYDKWIWWVFSYLHVSQWGGHLQSQGVEVGKFAMVQAFLAKKIPSRDLMETFTFESARTVFQYAVLTVLGFLVYRLRDLWASNRQALWVGLLWLVAFVPFFIWWEPWNIEFWVSSTAPCWILMGLVASSVARQWRNPVIHWANRGLVITAWAGLIFLLFLYNFQGNVIKAVVVTPGQKPLLSALDWKVRKDDLLVLTGMNTVPFYIDRYQKRSYMSLQSFLRGYQEQEKKEEPGAKGKTGVKTEVLGPPPDPWADLDMVFQTTWKHHHKIFVLSEVVEEKDDWHIKFNKLMNLADGQLTGFFKKYDLVPVTYHQKVYFYELDQPQPTPEPQTDEEPSPQEKSK